MIQNLIRYIIESISRYSPIILPLILVVFDIFAQKKIKEIKILNILPKGLCLCGVSFYVWLLISLAKHQTISKVFNGIAQINGIIFCIVFLIFHFAFYEWCVNPSHKVEHLAFSYGFGFISLAFPFLIL